MTDHFDIGSRYLAAVEQKLTTEGYRSDAEMRTDTLFGLAHIMADIAQSLRAVAGQTSAPTAPPEAAPEPKPEPAAAEPAEVPTKPKRKPPAEGDERTCILCGRTGTRRYVETDGGWKCAPSSADKCRRKVDPWRRAPTAS